jgi:dTDP-4-dehydrorhamnose reductase
MLGHVVTRLFAESGLEVHTSSRRYEGRADDALVDEVMSSPCAVVVNCIGATSKGATSAPLMVANAWLPPHFAAALGTRRLLVHASTDGVFSGACGPYDVRAATDATDAYGLSKRLGELCLVAGKAVVLRTSIIGPELGEPRHLLGWFLRQRAEVSGYADHLWNGITTLEWAKIALRAVKGEVPPGLHQPGCATYVSKYELLRLAGEEYSHTAPVRRTHGPYPVDRRLVPTIECPPIPQQLADLHRWYGAG